MEKLENLNDVKNAVDGVRTVMVTTRESDQSLGSRPMTVQRFDEAGTIWFIVDGTADWVDTGSTEPANVAFVDGDDAWVSVAGMVSYSQDRAMLDELWDSVTDAYYPEDGKDSDRAWLMKVSIDRVDWWTNPSTLKFFYEVAKAQVTDERPEEGASGTINP